MQIESVVFIVGVVIQITSFSSWVQFAIGRLVSGLGVGALSAAVPMYQAEAAPPQIRGMLTATYQLFITFGILVAYCISIGARSIPGSGSWRTVVGIGILWPLVLIVGMQFMPESPRCVSPAQVFDVTHAITDGWRARAGWTTRRARWLACAAYLLQKHTTTTSFSARSRKSARVCTMRSRCAPAGLTASGRVARRSTGRSSA